MKLREQQTVYSRFLETAQVSLEKNAISYGNIDCTYRELKDRSSYIANCLEEDPKIIATWLLPGVDLVATTLAIFKSGKIYMPLSADLGNNRLKDMFSSTSCKVIITNTASKHICLKTIYALNLPVDYLYVIHGASELIKCSINAEETKEITHTEEESITKNIDESYIFYTSGTTGSGKAILGSHTSLLHFLDWEIKTFNISSSDRISLLSNITFDASLRDMFIPLIAGGTLCIPKKVVKNNLAELAHWIENVGISIIHCVPSIFRLLLKEFEELSQESRPRLLGLKHVLMAGEPIYVRDVERWRNCIGNNVELVNLYGTSETTLAKTFHRIGEISEIANQSIHAGQPIADTFVAIINNNNALCKIGEIGEVYIKTPFMTKGYYNNPDLNKQVFVQNPLVEKEDIIYKTGDLGRYLPGRDIEILGRQDSQVKVNGIRVELEEVEQAILTASGAREVLVIPHTTKENQVLLIAYYTGEHINEDELKNKLRVTLNNGFVPSYLKKMEELPLTVNGKVDKKLLPALSEIINQNEGSYEAPQTDTERSLELIWKDVLGVKRANRSSSFFDIGGTSLRCLQAISKIYKKFQVLVKVSEFFDMPNIVALAAHIDNEKSVEFDDIPLVPEQPYYQISKAQRRIWILDQVAEEKRAYNVPNTFRLKGQLDIEAFKKSIQTLVQRHESLRTNFVAIDTVPMQIIRNENIHVQYMDLRGDLNVELKIEEHIRAASSMSFDLEKDTLLRTQLIRTEEENFVFIFTLHHIIIDGWSIEVLTNDLFALYDHLSGGDSGALPPLKIQYKDYAAWHNLQLNTEAMKTHKRYWESVFEEELPSQTLELDFDRPSEMTFEGKTQSYAFNKEIKAKLKSYCKLHNVSLFMFFQAIWLVVFYVRSKQTDITIGSPVAGRNHPSLDNMVGLFMNMVVLRTKFEPSSSFSDFLQHIRKNTLKSLDHSAYLFDDLFKDLDLKVEKNRNPLYDVGYTFISELESSERRLSNFNKIDVEYLSTGFEFIKADMWFKVLDLSEDLIIDVSYNINLFKATSVSKILTDIQYLISIVLEDSYKTIEELGKLTEKNSHAIQIKHKKSIKERNLSMLRKINA